METSEPHITPITSEAGGAVHAHAADRLLDAIDRLAAPVCVGLDPVLDRLPEVLVSRAVSGPEGPAGAIRSFTLAALDAVAGIVPCVKFQSACYERFGHRGVEVLEGAIGAARERGLQVILDAKRGDIGISAEHYAVAAFGPGEPGEPGRAPADWITINAYLGADGIRPFLEAGGGAFALVRTSNPGGDALQAAPLAGGATVAERVAEIVASVGADFAGVQGYSLLGAVVGATKAPEAAALRARMPQQIFLVPGYGAQGGGLDDVLPCFDGSGRGAIVTASRSVIYAFGHDSGAFPAAVTDAARRFADEVGAGVGLR